jgi:hypothetical protein
MPHIRSSLAEGKCVTIGPKGTSMLPLIRQGTDYVELSPLPEKLKKYDLPLYRRPDGTFVLHRIIKAGTTYTCMGDNQFVPEPGLRQDQMIALVTAFWRGKRRHTTHWWVYRLYCRLWHFSRPVRHFWRRGIGWLKRHISKT